MSAAGPTRRWHPPVLLFIGTLVLASSLLSRNTSSQLPAVPAAPRIPTIQIEGHPYVSIDDLAAALAARIEYVLTKDKVLVKRSAGRDIVFTVMSSIYLVGQVQYRMPYPTRVADGKLRISSDVLSQLGLNTAPSAAETQEPPEALSADIQTYQAPTGEILKKRWAIDRIAIDPGHGGRDPGAVGPRKTYEKSITLSIAKRLGKKLEKELGVEVVYTRTGDTFVRLGARARIARQAEADLFISLHCNAGRRRAAGGIEVFFLSEAKTAAAAEVAELENAVLELEADEPAEDGTQNTLRSIALEILSSQFLKESQDLAASIRSRMARRFKQLDDRGVKQANFYVMRGTMGAMPSVLVEMGFISNPEEEKLLKRGSFQKNMADAIFGGIHSFKQNHERQLSNTK